jgi:hypothetical protein
MITEAQVAMMGADPANADMPFLAPGDPWEPWHSPVMVLAGSDPSGRPWLYLAARCGWFLGFAPQGSAHSLAQIATAHTESCASCRKELERQVKCQPEPEAPPR